MGGKSLPRRITEGCQIRLPFVISRNVEGGRAGTQKETEGSLANLQPPAAMYQQQPALLLQWWHKCHLITRKNPI